MLQNIITPASLDQPHKLTPPYSWCGHIPFASWLVSELRPQTFVELGTHTGNSYFSICQAVKSSAIQTRCFAVDTWQGDAHAGFYGDAIYEEVSNYNNDHYAAFSILLRKTFDEALEDFEDGSVDLLHIDGLHTYEAVKHDFETWLPKLSKSAVVLFHDTAIHDRGFGVWKFWDEIRPQYNHLEFEHSCGLGVLAIGDNLPSHLTSLFQGPEEEKRLATTIFSRLGTAIKSSAEEKKLQKDFSQASQGVKWLQAQIDERETSIEWLKEQLRANKDAVTEMTQKQTELRQENEALQNSLNRMQTFFAPILWVTQGLKTLQQHTIYFVKNKVTGTPFAPPLIAALNYYRRIKSTLKTLPSSRQNGPALNMSIPRRSRTLLSEHHTQWFTSLDIDDLPEVDLSIVTHNSRNWIPSFLESLTNVDYPASKISLYFVDNQSTDNTVDLLNTFAQKAQPNYKQIKVLEQKNLGFGMGHDAAIRAGSAPFVLATNVDLVLTEDAIRKVVSMAANDADNVASWELRQKPFEHPKYYDPVTLETNWSSHACILFRRSAYEKVGGYEHRIFMYGEDVELSYRFREAGYLLRFAPHAVVWHYTYTKAGQVKPIQFQGSSLANAYLRMRYGNLYDIAAIIPLQFAAFVRGGGFSGSRLLLLKNFFKIAKNAPHFLNGRKESENIFFPFRAFDYELIRDGAFYEAKALPDEPPLVSIITRTHGPDTSDIRECIASVINQTYPNIEHVIVEDGGNHKAQLIEQTRSAYHGHYNAKYFALDKVGRSAAGNIGMGKANGDYFILLDEDDLLFPDHVEVLVNEILSAPQLAGTYSLAWDCQTQPAKAGEQDTYKEVVHETPRILNQEFDRNVLNHHNYLPIQAVLFSRALFEQHGGFDETMTYLEDWDLWKRFTCYDDFKLVRKTTSLFHTPYNLEHRVRRQVLLDSAYDHAREKTNAVA